MDPSIWDGRNFKALFILIPGLILSGCGKSKKPETPQAAPPEQAVSAEAIAAPAPPAPPHPSQAPAESGDRPIPANMQDVSLDLESLNIILDNYYTAYEKVPKDINDMIRLKLIKRAPTPPPGKKYVIDPKKHKINVVDAR
jgi:hypothetical protein